MLAHAPDDRRFLLLGIPGLSLLIAVANLPTGPYGRWPLVLVHWLIGLYFTTGYWPTGSCGAACWPASPAPPKRHAACGLWRAWPCWLPPRPP